jgi:hypothetical protein
MLDIGQPITWPIELQTCSGKLYIIELASNDTGVTSMQKLQDKYPESKIPPPNKHSVPSPTPIKGVMANQQYVVMLCNFRVLCVLAS